MPLYCTISSPTARQLHVWKVFEMCSPSGKHSYPSCLILSLTEKPQSKTKTPRWSLSNLILHIRQDGAHLLNPTEILVTNRRAGKATPTAIWEDLQRFL